MLTKKELHELELAKKNEEAKDASVYETYEYRKSKQDEQVALFSARRIGRSHVRKEKPCQDYCMTADGEDYIILSAADGVSSCERSDVGSRLACETVTAVVEDARKHSKTEEDFVRVLQGMKFRKKIVNRWVQNVLKHVRELAASEEVDEIKELYKYGSTLLFTVITKNWYVAGNLGDGQILFFTEQEAVKVRAHAPKESSKVRSLVNEKCYLEDFHMVAYPRTWFQGVLLSTDGMYDVLYPGHHFHRYAKQLTERFLKAGEPLQPFCYEEEGEMMKDISRVRTSDDCSIVLAVDVCHYVDTQAEIRREVETHTEERMLRRKMEEISLYDVIRKDEYQHMVVSNKKEMPEELPKLESAAWLTPSEVWETEGHCYRCYPETEMVSLETLYCEGKLREQRENILNASYFVLDLYKKLSNCKKELEGHGLFLNKASHFLMGIHQENGTLLIMPEAVSKKEEGFEKEPFWNYFESLYGVLRCGDKERPIFQTGYVAFGQTLCELDESASKPMCCMMSEKSEFYFKNLGEKEWIHANGVKTMPGERIRLEDGLTILIPGEGEDAQEKGTAYDFRRL